MSIVHVYPGSDVHVVACHLEADANGGADRTRPIRQQFST